jgi:polysaccharide export outer membrane protein
MNICKSIFIVLMICLLGTSSVWATDYRNLAIEQKRNDLKSPPSELDNLENDLQKEKDLIFRQMSIITGDEDTRYIIVPGDTLTISYEDRGEKTTNIYQVSSKGEIFLPLAGAIKVSDLNRKQARETIEGVLSAFIRYPHVSMLINDSGTFMVLGAIGPGVYDLKPNLHIMEALVRAGYNPDQANLRTVVVMRGRDNPTVIRLNLAKMVNKGDQKDNILIKPGDLIYVPHTFLYNFDKVKDKLMDYVIDYYTLGGATILKQQTTSESNVTTTSP